MRDAHVRSSPTPNGHQWTAVEAGATGASLMKLDPRRVATEEVNNRAAQQQAGANEMATIQVLAHPGKPGPIR